MRAQLFLYAAAATQRLNPLGGEVTKALSVALDNRESGSSDDGRVFTV